MGVQIPVDDVHRMKIGLKRESGRARDYYYVHETFFLFCRSSKIYYVYSWKAA